MSTPEYQELQFLEWPLEAGSKSESISKDPIVGSGKCLGSGKGKPQTNH